MPLQMGAIYSLKAYRQFQPLPFLCSLQVKFGGLCLSGLISTPLVLSVWWVISKTHCHYDIWVGVQLLSLGFSRYPFINQPKGRMNSWVSTTLSTAAQIQTRACGFIASKHHGVLECRGQQWVVFAMISVQFMHVGSISSFKVFSLLNSFPLRVYFISSLPLNILKKGQ